MKSTKIIIADDHHIFADGLRSLLNQDGEHDVIAIASNGNELIDLLQSHSPQLVLMDINMPQMNGINSTKIILKNYPDVKIIILTMYKNKSFINTLLMMGAHGYILKNATRLELLNAIDTVMKGGVFISNEIAEFISQKTSRYTLNENQSLSKREHEIINEISKGLNTKQIAEKLYISYYTVETHRKNVLNKLGLNNVAELITYAAQSGLID